jgi:hypothetical protein
MNDKPHRYGFLLYSLILIGYIGLFPLPLGKELLLDLQWICSIDAPISITENQGTQLAKEKSIGFVLGKTLGYISDAGDLVYKESVLHAAVVTDRGFINYSAIPEVLVVKDSRGNILSTLKTEGYPFMRKDRLFIVSADGCGVAEVTLEGEVRWKKDFNQLITSMDAGTTVTAVGLWDGTLLLLGPTGEVITQEKLTQGPYSVIYLSALTKDDRMLGVVFGLKPQRGILWEKTPTGYKRVRSFQLSSDFRRPMQGILDANTGMFIIEDSEGISLIGRGEKETVRIALKERIGAIAASPIDGLFLFYTQQDEGYKIRGITYEGRKVFIKSLPTREPFWFQGVEGAYFVGFNKRILKYRVVLG